VKPDRKRSIKAWLEEKGGWKGCTSDPKDPFAIKLQSGRLYYCSAHLKDKDVDRVPWSKELTGFKDLFLDITSDPVFLRREGSVHTDQWADVRNKLALHDPALPSNPEDPSCVRRARKSFEREQRFTLEMDARQVTEDRHLASTIRKQREEERRKQEEREKILQNPFVPTELQAREQIAEKLSVSLEEIRASLSECQDRLKTLTEESAQRENTSDDFEAMSNTIDCLQAKLSQKEQERLDIRRLFFSRSWLQNFPCFRKSSCLLFNATEHRVLLQNYSLAYGHW
jgi:hypothetical protein